MFSVSMNKWWPGNSVVAVTLAGSGATPLSVRLCPMNVTDLDLN